MVQGLYFTGTTSHICTPAVTWRCFRNHLLNCDYTANVYFGFRYSFVWNLSYSVKNSARCYNKLPVVLLAPSYRRTVATRLEATTWRLAPKTKVPKYLLCQHFWRYYIKVGYSGGILTACVSHCEVCLSYCTDCAHGYNINMVLKYHSGGCWNSRSIQVNVGF